MNGELVIDSFAGGGGASEGIKAALGRDPDIAINHDALALAMHRINHPGTRHLEEDVVTVDAIGMCAGRPIGLFWLSPDCKHHSKAKGGRPREKNIRGLAWTGIGMVKALPRWQRPRVVILENVEEFADWGPLLDTGLPCPDRRGETFRSFVVAWERLGYVVEHRELRACDYGAPTIRKRLFMIARRDGRPIVWPKPTHGNPKCPKAAAEIAAGRLKPWRAAAEIIDWTLPCPSIFDTSEEIKARYGIRANRPLAPATMARIAKGTMRYVVEAANPFIVPVTHQGDHRVNGIDEPLRTQTTARRGEHAVMTPFVTKFNRGATGHAIDEPVHTITSHASATRGGGASPLGIVVPVLVGTAHGEGQGRGRAERPVDEPLRTVTASNDHALVSPFLVPRYGERPGQEPRTRGVDEPAPVIVPTGNEGSLAAVHLQTMRNSDKPFSAAGEPAHTITAEGARPAVVAAFLAQHNMGMVGHDTRSPVSTIVGKGCTQGLVAAHLTHAFTSNTRGGEGDPRKPLKTVLAGGNHAAAVYAFLAKYYGAGEPSQAASEPLHTVTAKPRHGLVVVTIGGEPFVVVDIGMRMLAPRERFNAQGFRPDYEIRRGLLEDGTTVAFTLEQQGRMCGNSVSPVVAEALIAANYQRRDIARESSRGCDAPLLAGAIA